MILLKGRVAYFLLSLLLVALIILTGCSPKQFDEISGPTWVTRLTMPLIARAMKKDANGVLESYSEIRLGSSPNGIGNEGLDLGGKSFYSYKVDDLQRWEEKLETVTVELGTIAAINLENPVPGSATVPPGVFGTDVDLTDTGFAGVRLSGAYIKGTYNDITISLQNGQAGAGGFTLLLVEKIGEVTGEIIAQADLQEGESSGNFKLAGRTLTPNMRISVEGDIEATDANTEILFTGHTLEIAGVTVSGDKLSSLLELGDAIDLGDPIELGENFPTIALNTAKLEFAQVLPESIKVTAELTVEGQDKFKTSLGSRALEVILAGEGTTEVEFKGQLNDILNLKPHYLAFKFSRFNLSPTSGDTAEITLGSVFSCQVTPEIGFGKVTTDPEKVDVEKTIKENPLQAFRMYLISTNNSPAGFDLNIYFSPDPTPVEDDNAVKISFSIKPAVSENEPGVFNNTNTPIELTADELNYLTTGDSFYHQIEFANQSKEGTITNDHYIEIRSWAQVDVLLNKKEVSK